MSIADVRRRRLRLLIQEWGTQAALSEACGYTSDNYLSQLLKPGKPFAEKAARRIEKGGKKPQGWLDIDSDVDSAPVAPWPFGFDRGLWDRLPPPKKNEVENSLLQLILGASVQEATAPSRKRKA